MSFLLAAGTFAAQEAAGSQAAAMPADEAGIALIQGLAAGDLLKIRTGASPLEKVVGRLPNGATVRTYECQVVKGYEWCRVDAIDDAGLSGWAPARYLHTVEVGAGAKGPSDAADTANPDKSASESATIADPPSAVGEGALPETAPIPEVLARAGSPGTETREPPGDLEASNDATAPPSTGSGVQIAGEPVDAATAEEPAIASAPVKPEVQEAGAAEPTTMMEEPSRDVASVDATAPLPVDLNARMAGEPAEPAKVEEPAIALASAPKPKPEAQVAAATEPEKRVQAPSRDVAESTDAAAPGAAELNAQSAGEPAEPPIAMAFSPAPESPVKQAAEGQSAAKVDDASRRDDAEIAIPVPRGLEERFAGAPPVDVPADAAAATALLPAPLDSVALPVASEVAVAAEARTTPDDAYGGVAKPDPDGAADPDVSDTPTAAVQPEAIPAALPAGEPVAATAVGDIPCARYLGQPMTRCAASVVRTGERDADVTVAWPDGGSRIIRFRDGAPAGSNSRNAFRFTREGALSMIRIGVSERFEITDELSFGD